MKPTYEELQQRVRELERVEAERRQAEKELRHRVEILTHPLDVDEAITFEDLFDLDDIQELQDQFAEATGVASIITRTDGTPITRPSRFCRLCQDIIRKTDKGLANCLQSDAMIGEFNRVGPTIQPCLSGGLWDAGAGISVGGKHLANWLIGQVRDETQTEEKIRAYARNIGADEDEAVSAFQDVPAMSPEQFSRVSQVLFTLANQLSLSAYQNIQQARVLAAREQAEMDLRESEERYRSLHNASFGGIAIHDNGIILECNQGLAEMSGYSIDELVGMNGLELIADRSRDLARRHISEGYERPYEIFARDKEGVERPTRLEARNIPFRGKMVRAVEFRDLTEIKQAEEEQQRLQEQLAQAQKMESVGQLAGGIAHDFNNLLQAILGYGEIAMETAAPDSEVHELLGQIMQAGDRARELVAQLLAFSRRQVLEMLNVDLNDAVSDLLKMLHRVIGEHVELRFVKGTDLGIVRADAGQIGQILTNLCVNARDAMPDGGTITIETMDAHLDEDYCENIAWARPGRFALLSVTDTGGGMDEATKHQVFEPFFTTKGVGEGTGLGLSTVYGLVKQHQGFVNVYSEVGKGSTFRIYLPVSEQVEAIASARPTGPVRGGTETILLAEDDEMVRALTTTMLERGGYTVLPARDGDEALAVFARHADEIDLTLLDVIMPGLGGRAVHDRIRETHPDLPALFASGYSMNALHTNFVLDDGLELIQKPTGRMDLLRKVRDVLDAAGGD